MRNDITSRQRGVALITTLALVALLSFTLLSYFSLVSWEKIRSKSFLEKVYLQSISDIAAQEALAKITDGCELPWQINGANVQAAAHMTACPGLMSIRYFHTNLNTNSPFSTSANPRLIPLFSWTTNSENLFNINTPNNPFHPGEFYLTGYPEPSNTPIYVHWLPVYKNPTLPASSNNPVVGRYAYWVDVENSKINLRLATRPSLQNTNTNSDSTAFSWWFDWLGSMRPRVADNSWLDWNALIGTNMDSAARTRMLSSLTNHFSKLENHQTNSFNFWPEIYSLWNFQDPLSDRTLLATIRKALGAITTLYGCDDERDPMGQERINLVKFLREGTSSPSYTDIFSRLTNTNYNCAYLPGVATPKSFAQSLNGFAGNGNPNNDNNGQAAVEQMLVNIAEYSLPKNLPPSMSRMERGIIPAKSAPYVEEVSTRARSALYLLSTNYRVVTNFIHPQSNILYNKQLTGLTPDGQTVTTNNFWFLTNVIADVQMKPVKAFRTNMAGWYLSLSYRWDISAAARYPRTQTSMIDFSQVATNYLYLGVLPGSKITNAHTALQIQGWEVRNTNGLFHRVPLKHVGQSSVPRNWWEMAQAQVNVGKPDHTNSLYEYQSNHDTAVGWFVPSAWSKVAGFAVSNIFYDTGTNVLAEGNANPTVLQNVSRLVNSTTNNNSRGVLAHVSCKDPPLGHRTGNMDIFEYNMRGHFYGLLGHGWRYRPDDQPEVPKEKLTIANGNEDLEVHKEIAGFKLYLSADANTVSDYTEARGNLMTSVGEIGYVNSGLMGIPILFSADGKTIYSLNYPENGPPLRMIFDLFTPGAFHNNDAGEILPLTNWANYTATNTPSNPRRGTWNVNAQWVSLDENGFLKIQHPSQRGFDAWLKFVGGSMASNTNLSLKHFNSEIAADFPAQGEPMGTALIANQISTSANAFTIHIVAQTLKEIAGKNFVTSEQWTQMALGVEQDTSKSNPETGAPFQNRYHTLYYKTKNNAR